MCEVGDRAINIATKLLKHECTSSINRIEIINHKQVGQMQLTTHYEYDKIKGYAAY